MKVINLEKLTIDKAEENIKIRTLKVSPCGSEDNLFTLKKKYSSQMESFVNQLKVDINSFNVEPLLIVFESDQVMNQYSFEMMVNVLLATFVESISTTIGRQRERRLGVPDGLKDVNLSVSVLKKMINYKTKVDLFNISIKDAGENRYNMLGDD